MEINMASTPKQVIINGIAYVPEQKEVLAHTPFPKVEEYFTVRRSTPTIDRSYLDDVFVCVALDNNTICGIRYCELKHNGSCVVLPKNTWHFLPASDDVAKAVFKELYSPKKSCPHSYLHRFGCKCNCS